ncbi:ABC transporter ATP-binding protein [Thermohalobacter berrensis]|uniref:Quaternary amine transport ATP-binding protein n=1 Tax=Thermohalobacter berrensis TaxID=99594 RepID=A0A419T2N7_9FIRM|nr:betaine/proline/choline family ABC transporter ATP-binding protein [Thermohalobacter berrensis]RKD31777.1 glycine/betaine ABC transporter ATP-binding protein [Thermohalobacter berrensis]
MIRFENVSKVYEDGFKAIDNMNLHIKKGELLVLIGPSGCGKTTTMKMINRLIEPTEGKIFIDNKEISKINPVELRRNIGYVIQQIGLLPHMTIGENVALVPKLKKWDEKKYMKRVKELLDLVGLEPNIYINRYPAELSGGQQQRVGVIRALAADPPIILMDEPFSALDPISREQLQDELVRLQEEINKTIVFVTHDMDEALKIADRICIMKEGKIVQLDKPEKILQNPANDFVKNFIGEERLERSNVLPSINDVLVEPMTIEPNQTLKNAVGKMRKYNMDNLIVVDMNGNYLGVVNIWDIEEKFQDNKLLVKDVMKPIPSVNENQNLNEVITLMRKENLSNVPVIKDKGQLKGIITHASVVEKIVC